MSRTNAVKINTPKKKGTRPEKLVGECHTAYLTRIKKMDFALEILEGYYLEGHRLTPQELARIGAPEEDCGQAPSNLHMNL